MKLICEWCECPLNEDNSIEIKYVVCPSCYDKMKADIDLERATVTRAQQLLGRDRLIPPTWFINTTKKVEHSLDLEPLLWVGIGISGIVFVILTALEVFKGIK